MEEAMSGQVSSPPSKLLGAYGPDDPVYRYTNMLDRFQKASYNRTPTLKPYVDAFKDWKSYAIQDDFSDGLHVSGATYDAMTAGQLTRLQAFLGDSPTPHTTSKEIRTYVRPTASPLPKEKTDVKATPPPPTRMDDRRRRPMSMSPLPSPKEGKEEVVPSTKPAKTLVPHSAAPITAADTTEAQDKIQRTPVSDVPREYLAPKERQENDDDEILSRELTDMLSNVEFEQTLLDDYDSSEEDSLYGSTKTPRGATIEIVPKYAMFKPQAETVNSFSTKPPPPSPVKPVGSLNQEEKRQAFLAQKEKRNVKDPDLARKKLSFDTDSTKDLSFYSIAPQDMRSMPPKTISPPPIAAAPNRNPPSVSGQKKSTKDPD